jgi:predicted nucleic acid-binding protein
VLQQFDKRTVHASERDCQKNKAKREAFISGQHALAPERLVFSDENGVLTGMTRRYGRAYKKSRVCDAVPINRCLIGLSNIGLLDILRPLYGTVIITPDVAMEYGASLPDWISIQAVVDTNKTVAFNKFIDLGESSAIALATEMRNVLLIVDDRRARQFALDLGLEITGTLGVMCNTPRMRQRVLPKAK